MKLNDKQQIQDNIQQGGKNQQLERRPGISQRVEHRGLHVVHEQKGQSPEINPQIKSRIRENIVRHVHQTQNPVVKRKAESPQRRADYQKGNQSRGHSRFHLRQPPGSQKLGNNHRASHASSDGNGNKHIRNRVGGAHRSQRVLTDKFPHYDRIHNIIKLLEQISQNQGKRKKQKSLSRAIRQHTEAFLTHIFHLFYLIPCLF